MRDKQFKKKMVEEAENLRRQGMNIDPSRMKALRVDDIIYLNRASDDIVGDALHEGWHALDPVYDAYAPTWSRELRAWDAENRFRIDRDLPPLYTNEYQMRLDIFNTYPSGN